MRPRLPFRLYRVEGESMQPTLQPGALLLGSPWIRPKVGHIAVLARSPLSLKRIMRIDGDKFWVEGDNKTSSTDSRTYGPVDKGDIVAVIFVKVSE